MPGVLKDITLSKLLTKIISAIHEITGENSTTTTKPVTVMEIARKTGLSPALIGKAILQVGDTLFHLETRTSTRYGKEYRHLKAVYLHI